MAPSSVAENSIVWRVGRGLVEQAAHLGQESHVGHAVGFVDHDDLDAGRGRARPAGAGRRGGPGTRRARRRRGSAAGAARRSRHRRRPSTRAAPRAAASGSSSRQICAVSSRVGARISAVGWRLCARSMRAMSGTPNAMVLPEPVGARPHTSRPARASGIVAAWMSNGCVIPPFASAATRSAGRRDH